MRKITDKELDQLESFIGYGKKNAKIIFMGLEEGGGGFENIKKRIKYIESIEKNEYILFDCRDFHINVLKIHDLHKEYSKNVKFQPVWRFMSYLMLRLEGRTATEIKKKNKILLRDYQNNKLGTVSDCGETLLTEIYPIPCKNYKTWGTAKECYKNIIPQYESKSIYRKKVLEKRIKIFNSIINSNEFGARAIICYGKSSWNVFKKFFQHFNVHFSTVKNCPSCEIGILNKKVKIFLTPFFGNGQMSYKKLDIIKDEILLT